MENRKNLDAVIFVDTNGGGEYPFSHLLVCSDMRLFKRGEDDVAEFLYDRLPVMVVAIKVTDGDQEVDEIRELMCTEAGYNGPILGVYDLSEFDADDWRQMFNCQEKN